MPRDVGGNFNLVAGNPVSPGTIIESNWANTTLSDIAAALTDSLSRSGQGGMLVPFRFADGTIGAPGISWVNEPTAGWYRAAFNDFRYAIGGVNVLQVTLGGLGINASLSVVGNVALSGGNLFMPNNLGIYFKTVASVDQIALYAHPTDVLQLGSNWPTVDIHAGGASKLQVSAAFSELLTSVFVMGNNRQLMWRDSAAVPADVLYANAANIVRLGSSWASLLFVTSNVGRMTIDTTVTLTCPLVLPNNTTINFRNAANSATVPALYADAANDLQFGSTWGNIIFRTGANAERGRFNAVGGFKASTSPGVYVSSGSAVHEFVSLGNGSYVTQMTNGGTPIPGGLELFFSVAGSGQRGTGNYILSCRDVTGHVALIYSNGGLANFSANNANLSDVRAKCNFDVCPDHTDFVRALSFQRFEYIDNPNSGYVDDITAQDIEQLAPELVVPFGDSGMKGVLTHRLQQRINSVIPRLIQRIETLEAMLVP